MADQEVILRKVDSIQNCLQRVFEKTQNNSKWIDDFDSRDIVVLHLIRAIQLCVDTANLIISEQKWGIPRSLGESFYILKKNEVIDHNLMERLQKMVGFRNIATHAYKEINYIILKSIVDHRLNDFEEFYKKVLEFLPTGTS
ncbi:MAG: DUF86 domain-containing protein [Proteobacteria bacterium]|nr:DUF86 domain-containing protein [Pseudomonadota bacterium]